MSAAVSPSPIGDFRPGNWTRIPNSVIENQLVFTRAELALILIVLKRGGHGDPIPVSDRNWESWTGLSARLKEYAVVGLKNKCLTVEGRGETARYAFARQQWDGFVRTINRKEHRARTVGRAVEPKAGAKVHQECRSRGCALLAAGSGTQNVSSPVLVTPNAQPVARLDCGGAPSFDPAVLERDSGIEKGLSPLSIVPNAQRVAQTAAAAVGELWVKALSALQTLFPLVGLGFLARLVAVVKAVCGDVTDEELTEAIDFAWSHTARRQRAEGLFLFTVPNAVLAIRRRKRPSQPPGSSPPEDSIGKMVRSVADALRALGPPFRPTLAAVTKLLSGGEVAEEKLVAIERLIVAVVHAEIDGPTRAAIEATVQAEIKPYKDRMSAEQLKALAHQIRDREGLKALAIPRLSLFYA